MWKMNRFSISVREIPGRHMAVTFFDFRHTSSIISGEVAFSRIKDMSVTSSSGALCTKGCTRIDTDVGIHHSLGKRRKRTSLPRRDITEVGAHRNLRKIENILWTIKVP